MLGPGRMGIWLCTLALLGCCAARPGRDGVPVPASSLPALAFSREGRPLPCLSLGAGAVHVHLHAGIHGDEPEGIELLYRLQSLLLARPDLLSGLSVTLLPEINPDGLAAGTRGNSAGVDLNRNFPAANWRPSASGGPAPLSEPESEAVAALIRLRPPALVVSLHSARHSVNWDGPCEDLAQRMSLCNGYRTEASVGYPTPGSLGSWLGIDQGIPIITLELHRAPADQLWEENREALLEALHWVRRRLTKTTLSSPGA